jgi:hypothetical protein
MNVSARVTERRNRLQTVMVRQADWAEPFKSLGETGLTLNVKPFSLRKAFTQLTFGSFFPSSFLPII